MKTTRKAQRTPARKLHLKSILVPIDFSDASGEVIAMAGSLAETTRGKITLLHVVEPMEFARSFPYQVTREDLDQACRAALLKVSRQKLPRANLLRCVMVRHGNAVQEVVTVAQELKCDLILMARRSHTRLERALVGSVTERVVRAAPCPVLIVNTV